MPPGGRAGHNADDVAETVLLNLLRGDLPRLGRCAAIFTGEQGALPRVKPFMCAHCKGSRMPIFNESLYVHHCAGIQPVSRARCCPSHPRSAIN